MNTDESEYLLRRYFNNIATHEEREALFEAITENPDMDMWQTLILKLIPADQSESGLEQKYEDMLRTIIRPQSKVKKMSQQYWLWAAASIVFILGLSIYFYLGKKELQPEVTVTPITDVSAPQENRAMITLSDGSKVFLDSTDTGQLAVQKGIKLIKLANGQIAYQVENHEAKEIQFNTLINPRGSKVIDVSLSDGTRVWLNAGSSLTYPIAFVENDRKVELDGEGYFEVAPDKSKPFYVGAGEMEIKVLGTHFNVNAYGDNDAVKMTLLEGSVSVKTSIQSTTLKPGEQANLLAGTHKFQTTADIDVDQVMAWKNGYFSFQDASLKEVMKQISRWYDVDVVYKGNAPERVFGGEMQRSLALTQILKLLGINKIKYEIVNKTLIIKS